VPDCLHQLTDGFATNPTSLHDYYRSGKYAHRQPVDDPDGRASFVLTMIEEGIAEEARLNGGINREAGLPAEVVVVDRDGIRPGARQQ